MRSSARRATWRRNSAAGRRRDATDQYALPRDRRGARRDPRFERSDDRGGSRAAEIAAGGVAVAAPRPCRGSLGGSSPTLPRASRRSIGLVDEIAPRRRGVQIALVAAIVIVLGGGAIAFAARPAVATPCSAVSQPFDAMWSVPAQTAMRSAFIGAGGDFREHRLVARRSGDRRLGPSMGRSAPPRVRGDACPRRTIGRARRSQDGVPRGPPARARRGARIVRGRRSRCRDRALRTVRSMEPLARCEDTMALLGAPQPPFAQAPAIAAAKREVDRIRRDHACEVHGRYGRPRAEGRRCRDPAPLRATQAAALYQLGEAQINAQRWQPARTSLEAAALAADRAGDDRLRAKSWIEDIYVISWGLQKGDEALHARDLAIAALSRVPDRRRSRLISRATRHRHTRLSARIRTPCATTTKPWRCSARRRIGSRGRWCTRRGR